MFNTLISASELHQHYLGLNWVIIDCRFRLIDPEAGRRNYLKAHIPGAAYAHLDDDLSGPVVPGKTGRHPLPSVEDAAALFSSWGITDGVQVVAYDDMSGAIAARLWWMLRWLGHEAVAVLDGGWPAWEKAGYPVQAGRESCPAKEFIPSVQPSARMDIEEVANRTDATLLIDSRTPERYRGEQEPIDPVAGHIPGAVNYPHPSNVGADGQWQDAEQIKSQLEQILSDTQPEKVVFYCGSGVTACRNILAYEHAGLGEAVLYPGSWSEWIADGKREVAN